MRFLLFYAGGAIALVKISGKIFWRFRRGKDGKTYDYVFDTFKSLNEFEIFVLKNHQPLPTEWKL